MDLTAVGTYVGFVVKVGRPLSVTVEGVPVFKRLLGDSVGIIVEGTAEGTLVFVPTGEGGGVGTPVTFETVGCRV